MASSSHIDGMTVASSIAMGRCSLANSVGRIVRMPSAWQRAGFLSPVVDHEQPHDTASWIVPIQR